MPTLRERIRFRFYRLKARLGAVLLERASRKRMGLLDRFCSRILGWVTHAPKPRAEHFMRDQIVDADIEFQPQELDHYQQQAKNSTKTPAPLCTPDELAHRPDAHDTK